MLNLRRARLINASAVLPALTKGSLPKLLFGLVCAKVVSATGERMMVAPFSQSAALRTKAICTSGSNALSGFIAYYVRQPGHFVKAHTGAQLAAANVKSASAVDRKGCLQRRRRRCEAAGALAGRFENCVDSSA